MRKQERNAGTTREAQKQDTRAHVTSLGQCLSCAQVYNALVVGTYSFVWGVAITGS